MITQLTVDLTRATSPWSNTFIGPRSNTLCIQTFGIQGFLPNLSAIYAQAFQGPPWYESWSQQASTSALLDYVKRGSCFVISLDNEGSPLGLGIAYGLRDADGGKKWYIAELCTSEAARRRGICSDLLHGLLTIGADAGYDCATSRTRIDNIGMITIFEKAGFTDTGRITAKTGGAESERIWFSRPFQL